MELFVDFVHRTPAVIGELAIPVKDFLLSKYPYVKETTVFVNAWNGALALKAANEGKPRMYWLHSLVSVILASYGGGVLVPLLLAKPSFVMSNDLVVFACIVVWYAVFYLNFDKILNFLPIKMIWLVFIAIFRVTASINMVDLSLSILPATTYYPIPFFGPILVATLLGTLGAFLPFEKGLTAISKGTPWPMQGAFINSAFYHIMINDKHGFVGVTMRNIFGTHSRETIILCLLAMHIIQLELQAVFSPDANIFTPIHKLFYLIFQVQGPAIEQGKVPYCGWDKRTRDQLEKLVEVLVYVGVFSVICLHTKLTVVPASFLTSGDIFPLNDGHIQITERQLAFLKQNSLHMDSPLGSCQLLSKVRPCTPLVARLEDSADATQLTVYATSAYYYNINDHLANKTPVAQLPFDRMGPAKEYLHVTLDGRVIGWSWYSDDQENAVDFYTMGKFVAVKDDSVAGEATNAEVQKHLTKVKKALALDTYVCAKYVTKDEQKLNQYDALTDDVIIEKIALDSNDGRLVGICAKKISDEL